MVLLDFASVFDYQLKISLIDLSIFALQLPCQHLLAALILHLPWPAVRQSRKSKKQ
jgi:hypothetical protein